MGGLEKTAQFARLFLALEWTMASAERPTPIGLMDAITQWVEEGKAPESIIAELRDKNGSLLRTRPLFPTRSERSKGSGADDAANFVSSLPAP
jgi:hypothetical protein